MHYQMIPTGRCRPIAASALLAASVFAFGACNDNELAAPRAVVNLPSIRITPGATTIRIGGSQQFTAEVKSSAGQVMSDAAVQWVSADTMIARVSPAGLVTVVTRGTAGITARYQNVVAVVPVTVMPAAAIVSP